jgi:hypothetical protein
MPENHSHDKLTSEQPYKRIVFGSAGDGFESIVKGNGDGLIWQSIRHCLAGII